MYTTVASLALIGLAAARPATYSNPPPYYPSSVTSLPGSYPSGYPVPSGYPSKGEVPFSFPSTNGSFPQIVKGSPQLLEIEQQAHGTLSNASGPGTLTPDTILSLGFIAFNELFEVAFFTELVNNITARAPGFDNIPDYEEVLANLKVIQAQEELHALNANFAFDANTGKTILPCEYVFPVSNFTEAIALASTFTDVVLGTLPDIQTIFAKASNDSKLIRGVGAVIGQEGEQNGFYRNILHKVPSALPFLTASARDFAFSAINQNFVVPNSCKNIDLLTQGNGGLKIFDVLTLESSAADITSDADSTIEFSFQTSKTPSFMTQTLFITYINQQNVPLSYEANITGTEDDGAITLTVPFPGKSQEMNGLTIAALTNTNGFTSVDAVADYTIAGPALIEVN